MALLKKIKAATLMETLVATIIIVIIFMIASAILNQVFLTTINGERQEVNTHLRELEYKLKNKKISVPYREAYNQWNIEAHSYREGQQNIIELIAENPSLREGTITKKYVEN